MCELENLVGNAASYCLKMNLSQLVFAGSVRGVTLQSLVTWDFLTFSLPTSVTILNGQDEIAGVQQSSVGLVSVL